MARMGSPAGAVRGAGERSLELDSQQEMVQGRQLGELTQRSTAQNRRKKP